MSGFIFTKLDLNGAYCIENFSVGDKRGRFTKCFEKEIYKNAGIDFQLDETFTSVSDKNVVRGLHFQTHNPQTKLVCVVQGRVWDVIVDLRMDSPTYKKWIGIELSADNHKAIFIPKGFAHGFVSLEDNSVMLYQCDGAYDKNSDAGIIYDDQQIGIEWPVEKKSTIHSKRDMALMSMAEYEKNPMILGGG